MRAQSRLDKVSEAPAPGEHLHDGPPTVPRRAATVILLRGAGERLEVLLVRRNPAARFMGGAWVFPGGAVDAAEGDDDAAHRAAGIREVAEEAGIELGDAEALVPFARWITPEQVRIRFDTWFYLAAAPPGQQARPDGAETVDARWLAPGEALAAHESGDLPLVFPTIKNLERLARFGTADELLGWAAGREVTPVQPRVEGQGEAARIVLDGEDD
jgi:8-oxo-dGTP pyrophosphatase MutT (NUDIX family)